MIDKDFREYEMVIPAYGVYGTNIRQASEAILRKGPVLVDEKAVLEFQMTRKEVERLKANLEEFLKTSSDFLAFYVRDPEKTPES